MTIKNGDMPAMPIFNAEGFVSKAESEALSGEGCGLTKREQFAMAAMQGILAQTGTDYATQDLSEYAVEHADALLAALEKERGND